MACWRGVGTVNQTFISTSEHPVFVFLLSQGSLTPVEGKMSVLGAGWCGGTGGSPDLSAPPESQGLILPAWESLAVHRIRPPSKWGIHPEISRK